MDGVRPWHLLVIVAALALVDGCALFRPSLAGSTPGGRVVSAKCSACHPTPEPGSLTAVQFDRTLTAHARRVRPSAEERAALRSYLVTDGRERP
jgi:hypothetical protein